MPADLTNPFGPTCCDGGQACYTETHSAQPCGCDEGAGYLSPSCWIHKTTRGIIQVDQPKEIMSKKVKELDIVVYDNPLDRHLNEVVNKTWNAGNRCKDFQDHLTNAVVGLASEAGEVLDVHKKMWFHKEKDRSEEVLAELGDVCYYLSKVLELHGLTLEEVLAYNKKKLFKRYEVKD